MQSLEAALMGYNLPEPVATARVKALIEALFTVAADPHLPLLQIRGWFLRLMFILYSHFVLSFLMSAELLGTISGRLPAAVDASISALLVQYEKNLSSFLSKVHSDYLLRVRSHLYVL
jgi:hypothetical protein